MLTEESHLWAAREPPSAIFRSGARHTAAGVNMPSVWTVRLDRGPFERFKTRKGYKERHRLCFAQLNWAQVSCQWYVSGLSRMF